MAEEEDQKINVFVVGISFIYVQTVHSMESTVMQLCKIIQMRYLLICLFEH